MLGVDKNLFVSMPGAVMFDPITACRCELIISTNNNNNIIINNNNNNNNNNFIKQNYILQ